MITDGPYTDDAMRLGANGETTRSEILMTLAWAAPLTSGQLRRMVAPRMDRANFVRRVLRPMAQQDLIQPLRELYQDNVAHSDPARRRPPRSYGMVWQIGPRGFAEVAAHPNAPGAPAIVRQSMLGHDVALGEVITRVIEWTRPILGSIYLEHEERLDEARRRPIADAMLVVRYDPASVLPGTIPWRSAPPSSPDQHVRLYAIEVDRATERYETVYEKADSYRRVRNDPSFYARYGRMFPVLLVTVPGESRRTGWHAGWKQRWPYGRWLIATDADLKRDRWFEYADGVERWRSFVDGWHPVQSPLNRAAATQLPEATDSPSATAEATDGGAPLAGWWARKTDGLEEGERSRR